MRSQPNYSQELNNNMLDFVSDNFITQVETEPTRNDNILDLSFTTNSDIVTKNEIIPGIGDLNALTCDADLTMKRHKKPDRYVYQYKMGSVKADMCNFGDHFLSDNSMSKTVERNWNSFKNTLLKSMKTLIPQKKITSPWNLHWFTPKIKRLCQKEESLGYRKT